jgi:hypothetical protein
MLSITRHEAAEFFWTLWNAAEGVGDQVDLWATLTPVLSRLDLFCEDSELDGDHRAALWPTLAELRQRRGAPHVAINAELRRLANALLYFVEHDYAFQPAVLRASSYLRVLRGAIRADNDALGILSHCSPISAVARFARVDLPTARIGLGKMVDEGLAEYEFDPPDGTQEAFRIVDTEAVSLRIEELEEKQMTKTKVPVRYDEPLRTDYKELIRGLAMKHNVGADGSPTGTEIMLVLVDLGGDPEAFTTNVVALASELEAVLSKPAPAHGASQQISIHAGAFVNSPIQAGSPGGSQRVHNTVDIGEVRARFETAKEALAATDLDDDTRELVDNSLAQIEKQLGKPFPNPKLLVPMVVTIATALATVGAAGEGLDYVRGLIELLAGLA